jgi:hypothetical protein
MKNIRIIILASALLGSLSALACGNSTTAPDINSQSQRQQAQAAKYQTLLSGSTAGSQQQSTTIR